MFWKQSGFFISSENRIKNGQHFQELLYTKLLSAALAIIKIPGNPKLDWNIRVITLLTLSQEMLPLRKSREVKHSLSESKGIFLQMITLKKLAREAQQLGPEKEKEKEKQRLKI